MAVLLTLAPLFGDGAVLCRRKEVRLFGCAESGRTITARVLSAASEVLSEGACTAADNRFLLLLPPMEKAVDCTLTVSDGMTTLQAANISIGDVYFASGQSNMELELQNADEGKALIPVHDEPLVHYFNVPKRGVWNDEAIAAEKASHWERVRPGMARDMSAVAYFFACKLAHEIDCPVGIIDCYCGATSVTCWIDREALEQTAEGQKYIARYREQGGDKPLAQWQREENAFQQEMAEWNGRVARIKEENPDISWDDLTARVGDCPWHPPVGPGSMYRPCGLVETMTKRISPAALTGILYYQGEDDAPKTTQYDLLLMTMVKRLRELFRDDALPFLNVQLPMWHASEDPDNRDWPRIRLQQQKVADTLRAAGLAVLIDCGERNNIHPTDKRTPGERLCDVALRVVYGLTAPEYPRALRKFTKENVLTVQLSQPVVCHAEESSLLEIAGEDGVYVPAERIEINGCELKLSSPKVAHPMCVRYAYVNWGKVMLFGQNSLPLAPFLLTY